MSKQKTALITGITGQDGSYLAELLLEKNYKVVGLKRRTSLINTDRIDHIYEHDNFTLEYFDLNDSSCMYSLLIKYQPDEFYNLAAQSHVRVSFDIPENTVDGVAIGPMRILNAIRHVSPHTKFYQASSSEMFGRVRSKPQNEKTPFYPRSPYGISKVAGFELTRNYREAYNIFLVTNSKPLLGDS